MPLEVAWEKRGLAVLENLAVLLYWGEARPEEFDSPPEHPWLLSPNLPGRPLALSVALHILLAVTPVPAFLMPSATQAPFPATKTVELEGTGALRFLPPISPTPLPERQKTTGGENNPSRPAPNAQPIQPQSIASQPAEPNHPRQTLLWREALEEAPLRKADIRLPNLVIPPAPQTSSPAKLADPRAPGEGVSPRFYADAPLPPRPKSDAELALEQTRLENFIPRLTASPEQPPGSASVPQVIPSVGVAPGNYLQTPQLLALSALPGPPRPRLELPATNLKARFTAAPSSGKGASVGGSSGQPGQTAKRGNDGGALSGGASQIVAPDVLVAPASPPAAGATLAGPAAGSGLPNPPPRLSAQQINAKETKAEGPPEQTPRQRAQAMWQAVEGQGSSPGPIHNAYLYLADLTSQSSSWRVRFTQQGSGTPSHADENGTRSSHLQPPQVVRKADPCYPAEGRSERVEGTVVLYAVIDARGTVNDVVVVKGVTPEVDQRAAQALARSRFKPARKRGQPIAVEALVEIPFRLAPCF